MDFKVFTADSGTYNEYGGNARYELKDAAVLVVHHTFSYRLGEEPLDAPARTVDQITTYGPSGWLRIEEPASQAPSKIRKLAITKKIPPATAKKVATKAKKKIIRRKATGS